MADELRSFSFKSSRRVKVSLAQRSELSFHFCVNAFPNEADFGTNLKVVHGLTNAEFFATFAAAVRIGLVGGTTLIDRAICRAQ